MEVILGEIATAMASEADRGRVADFIPELARVDPKLFGIAVALPTGQTITSGDARVPFSIQSISKVFTLAMGLGRLGDELWMRVGREPSGLAFNSILQLEQEGGRPRNPFVNAGAIVVTDAILAANQPRELLAELLRFVRAAAGDDDIHINKRVAKSEANNAHRNWALAHMLKARNNLRNDPHRVLGAYFHQCAIEMNCVQLACAGRFLIGAPETALISVENVRHINALMMTCGHYDGSGEFACRVGLPGKSGVGGGILVVVPGRASVAIWSPGLNDQGNSALGTTAAERLARHMGWTVFS
ncbi:glutaminase [Mesorhizobium sp.]|uniref:glutaminase n=2 Tax=unclassified Mesorhizobium TaxID=325217 RepID=UPI000FD1B856|nr:glutaminase [Mesorhizobium sp.]RUV97438.1 glutaminase [Mesorhizobium sp. M5C.F.Ca.IN.020.14.1.1]RWG50782.1 MAG: glutaminase [Mesorhizobium sp.]RWH55769.1 MAG: glutaminase [Mesorhizobium sp.]RWI67887.1 MAG: glutaminase [Mesorhizobium sp.]RWI77876.1 MAG: glutaminase [Mesorhizobium sp.]